MVVKNIPTRMCDVFNCENIAKYTCAVCNVDLCEMGHTHSFGDGGHIQHAVKIDVTQCPYGGRDRIVLCPKCFTSTLPDSLFRIVKDHGEQIDQK